MSTDIRPFEAPRDLVAVVNLYNAIFAPLRPYYSWPVTVERFRDRVLGHWEFRPDGLLLAVEDGVPIGFILAGFRAKALTPTDVLTGDRGPVFISAVAVAPHRRRDGIGRALLAAAGDFARRHGRDQLVVSANPLAPMAFAVGVQDDWRDAHAFFLRTGFDHTGVDQNMARAIAGFAPTSGVARQIAKLRGEGYECRAYEKGDLPGLVRLLDEHDWPYWHLDMLSKVGAWTATRPFMETCFLDCATNEIEGPDEVAVVARGEEVLSFCAQTINPRRQIACLGPMLTKASRRNRGLGTVSLQLSLELAARKGAVVCDLWTGTRGDVSHFYAKSGFEPVLRWSEYRRTLLAGLA